MGQIGTAYCEHCGKPLVEGALFCPTCGRRVKRNAADTESGCEAVWDGKVRKCPYCGEPLESLTAYCPSCGHEIRNREAAGSLSELARRLARIDERKNEIPKRGRFFVSADWQAQISEFNQQKASIIRSFPIPSDVENIKEFVILAASSVDEESYSSFRTRHNSESSREVSDAWLAKCDQAMRKAKLVSLRPSDIKVLQDSIDAAKNRIRKARRKGVMQWVALCSPLLVLCVICAVLFITLPDRAEEENVRLQGVVEEIEQELDDGEYLRALLLADSLEPNGVGEDDLITTWEINREYWINRVVEEAAENGVDLSERAEQLNEERDIENESSAERFQRSLDEFNEEIAKAQETFDSAINGSLSGGE